MAKFTFIDLFAGIGGFYQGLSKYGGVSLGYSEINRDAIDSYCKNYNETKDNNLGDITKIETLPPHHILTAGVPCQSWSIAGKNLGFDDDRGQLWNDTIYLLKESKPKAFIFENVKGLADPRNREALRYILDRIKQAGYFANHYIINSSDYGVAQNRVRLYIIGFREKRYFNAFKLPTPLTNKVKLADILGVSIKKEIPQALDLFGNEIKSKNMSLSNTNGFNDYFLFNDLRNGSTTIHSWDIIETTKRQKDICYLLLKNRRKSAYGKLDGNPLSLNHFQSLDDSISKSELDELVELKIFKEVEYLFKIKSRDNLTNSEELLLSNAIDNIVRLDDIKSDKSLKLQKISITKSISSLKDRGILEVDEIRYEFKNSKISTGLFGVNRIFLPNSNIFPTLVASDTNDYITLKDIPHTSNYKDEFLKEVYFKNAYRKITKEEACKIQGFPEDFILPPSRARWMKLIGNSVSVPVIEILINAIENTDVFKR